MSQVTDQFVVCDQCGGAIPDKANRITQVSGVLVLGGTGTTFQELDFCCTQHMLDWISARPQIATPNPPYSPPPVQT